MNDLIRFLFYGMIVIGILILISNDLEVLYISLKKGRKRVVKSRCFLHIQRLIQNLYPEGNFKKITLYTYIFYIKSVILLFLSFFILNYSGFNLIRSCISLIVALLPYVYLRAKLFSIQVNGSYEGEIIIAELLNQYKINHHNIQEAIDRSIPYMNTAPIGCRHLFRLARRLRTQGTDEELRNILDDFSDACNTQWAIMLVNNMYYAITSGIDITAGLEDLLKECDDKKKRIEQEQRRNQEAYFIIRIFSPVVYVSLMGVLIYYFNFSIGDILYYQLTTSMGSLLFVFMIVCFFVCIIMVEIFKRPKFDI